MFQKSHSILIKAIALVLCISVIIPCTVFAATVPELQPYASDYLGAYQTYIYPAGSGKVQVWFDVTGSGTQDELGTLSIILYESSDKENWSRVKTFTHENYSNMLSYNDYHHGSYVSYQGTVGKYYKANVCFWGGSDGDGDTRYVWTSPKKAT